MLMRSLRRAASPLQAARYPEPVAVFRTGIVVHAFLFTFTFRLPQTAIADSQRQRLPRREV